MLEDHDESFYGDESVCDDSSDSSSDGEAEYAPPVKLVHAADYDADCENSDSDELLEFDQSNEPFVLPGQTAEDEERGLFESEIRDIKDDGCDC